MLPPPPSSTLFPYTTLFRSLVEEEAAVEVAVEGDAEVGVREPHVARGHLAVLLDHRVRHAVRKAAVRLVVDLGEAKRQHILRSEEHTSELQSLRHLVCRLLL